MIVFVFPRPRIMQSSVSDLARPNSLAAVSATLPRTRARADLHGIWERHVNGQLFDAIPVPSSQRPLGNYRLKRNCLLPKLTAGPTTYFNLSALDYFRSPLFKGGEIGRTG